MWSRTDRLWFFKAYLQVARLTPYRQVAVARHRETLAAEEPPADAGSAFRRRRRRR
jgi:hypothetical protein